MKHTSYIYLLLFTSAIFSCHSESTTDLAYGTARLEGLKNQLEQDTIFRDYKLAFNQHFLMTLSLQSKQSKFNKAVFTAGAKYVKTKEDYYRLCEKAGIVNPEQQEIIHFQYIKAYAKLLKKYPQIRQMSTSEKNFLMESVDHDGAQLIKSNKLASNVNSTAAKQ